MRKFMMENNMEAVVAVDSLLRRPHMYALGVAEGLHGELLVWNGVGALTRTTPKQGTITTSATGSKAALLVASTVPRWQAVPVPAAVRSYPALERLIARQAAQYGLDTTQALPFRLSGRARLVQWHVMEWPRTAAEHTSQSHKQYATKGQFENKLVEILGFFSRHHQTIFTHHTTFVHMHVRPAGQSFAAHVDSLHFMPGAATLHLPAK
jgi:acetolactate decarboxylase